ncbi:MAG: chorismate mutase, partial [Bacilli bacterium]|nr:chorismate mutase [Bacilli bacterium]
MSDLDKARNDIELADKQIADGFQKRMAAVKQVALYKKEHGLPIEDKKREEELIQKEFSYINEEELKEPFVSFLKAEMEVSKDYQRSLMEDGSTMHVKGFPSYPIHFEKDSLGNVSK